jgi:hypothetical protein
MRPEPIRGSSVMNGLFEAVHATSDAGRLRSSIRVMLQFGHTSRCQA